MSAVQENHHKNTPLSLLAVNFKRPYRARFIITSTRASEQLSHKAISKLALPTDNSRRENYQQILPAVFSISDTDTPQKYQQLISSTHVSKFQFKISQTRTLEHFHRMISKLARIQ